MPCCSSLHPSHSDGRGMQVVFPPQPRHFNGFTLDEEIVEFVPLGWFELRVCPHLHNQHVTTSCAGSTQWRSIFLCALSAVSCG